MGWRWRAGLAFLVIVTSAMVVGRCTAGPEPKGEAYRVTVFYDHSRYVGRVGRNGDYLLRLGSNGPPVIAIGEEVMLDEDDRGLRFDALSRSAIERDYHLPDAATFGTLVTALDDDGAVGPTAAYDDLASLLLGRAATVRRLSSSHRYLTLTMVGSTDGKEHEVSLQIVTPEVLAPPAVVVRDKGDVPDSHLIEVLRPLRRNS